jgi:hypothetical protein
MSFEDINNQPEDAFDSEKEPSLNNLLVDVSWLSDEWIRIDDLAEREQMSQGIFPPKYPEPDQIKEHYEKKIRSLKKHYAATLEEVGLAIELIYPAEAHNKSSYGIDVTIANQDRFLEYIRSIPATMESFTQRRALSDLINDFEERLFRTGNRSRGTTILDAQEAELLLAITAIRNELNEEFKRLDSAARPDWGDPEPGKQFTALFDVAEAAENGYGSEFLSSWYLIKENDDIFEWAVGVGTAEEYKAIWQETLSHIDSLGNNPKAREFQKKVAQTVIRKIEKNIDALTKQPLNIPTDLNQGILNTLDESKEKLTSLIT